MHIGLGCKGITDQSLTHDPFVHAAVVWPLAGHGIKKGLLALEVPVLSAVPASVLAYGVEASVRAARSLV